MTLLAEDLLLLLLDDATGKQVADSIRLEHALAGAVLVELALLGRVEESRAGDEVKAGRLVVRDGRPTGDPVLDEGLRRVADKSPVKPDRVLSSVRKGLRPGLLDRLAERGLLRREEGRVLGLFPTTRWPAHDSGHEAELRRRLQDVLVAGVAPDPRTAALVALLSAVDAVPKVVRGADPRDLRRRARAVAEGDWAAAAVRKAVDAVNGAVTAAIVAGAVVAGS